MKIEEYQIYFVMEFDLWKFERDLEAIVDNYEEKVLKVLQRNGIKNIQKLDPYAYSSVNISDIEEEDLEKFIMALWKEEWTQTSENILPLFGGLVIENLQDKTHTIHPQCCGELLDYQRYRSVLEDKNPDWQQIWIGHPWTFGKVKADTLYLTELLQCDTKEVDQKENITIYEFDLQAFQLKMNRALVELKIFEKKIATILKAQQIDAYQEIAHILVNGH